MESGVLTVQPMSQATLAASERLIEAGSPAGDMVRVVFNIPGFSLTHVWFKKDYPLPRHSHNADCLYYILAGELQLGATKLGPRDGFFIPANAPYIYRPGPEGVELLEFRTAASFDINVLNASAAFWDKAVETCRANQSEWIKAEPPAPQRLDINNRDKMNPHVPPSD
jgi:hypothetical protein